MKENSFLWVLLWYLKSHIKAIIMGSIVLMIFVVVFSLYSLELEAILYAFFLSACVVMIFIVYDLTKYYEKHKELCFLEKQVTTGVEKMPWANTLIEVDYQKSLIVLSNQNQQMISRMDSKQTEMLDYYTLWAHQIKTPIAAMRLLLQGEQSEENKELLGQIFKIEQYVEMVLGYLKIDHTSSDLKFQKHNLSELIKQGIRKHAQTFIRKNIALEFKEMDCTVLTDEKWLVFVIEQLLSNALKYTKEGKVAIYMEDEKKILVIEDTGIGIAEEDLPRVFEKGFTGYNGRMDKKATGIGLYLCKKILDKLSHKIRITSKVGVGTTVKIDLSSVKL